MDGEEQLNLMIVMNLDFEDAHAANYDKKL